MFLETIHNTKECPRTLCEIYLNISEKRLPRDPETMLALLRVYPFEVLDYYCKNKAPREMVPFIAQYFDNTSETWTDGKGKVQAMLKDDAFQAFEKAVGLDLGFTDALSDSRFQKDRVRSREAINTIIKRWWGLHDFEYGVTQGADEKTILTRMQAVEQAHETGWGEVREIIKKEGKVFINFDIKRSIGGRPIGSRRKIEVGKGIPLPDGLKKGVNAVMCYKYKKGLFSGDYILDNPDGIWVCPEAGEIK
jgi:hypothetical protein